MILNVIVSLSDLEVFLSELEASLSDLEASLSGYFERSVALKHARSSYFERSVALKQRNLGFLGICASELGAAERREVCEVCEARS